MKGKKNIIFTLLYVFFGAMVLIGVYEIAAYGWQSAHANQTAKKLANEVVVWKEPDESETRDKRIPTLVDEPQIPESIDFASLQAQNPEVVAWIYLPDTMINYPIVAASDNDKYLHRDLELKYSREGTLFVDADNHADFTDINTIIYGHNMKNGSMFKAITQYENPDFYKEHKVIYLYTPEHRYEIRPLAGSLMDADASIYTALNDPGRVETELNALYQKSTFTTDEDTTATGKLVTLSTCAYEYEDARYVLIGRLVEW